MAEYVKWRLTRLRAGVTMALFGLMAGLGLRADRGPQASPFERSAALTLPRGTHIPKNSIGSAQVKFHSLLLSDYKPQQVASYRSMVKLKKELTALDDQFIKMNDQLVKFEYKDDALNTFLLKDATAANAAKIEGVGLNGLVQGHGQVLTGSLLPGQSASPVVTIPGMLTLNGTLDPASNAPDITLLNTSGHTLLVNDGSTTQTVADGKSSSPVSMADGSVRTFQVMDEGGGQATTLTVSGFADGSAHRLVGQALVGTL